tara:strand:- start:17471 stop:17767 length:297 start_codon:yes stop_codon:yes gene_type:complete
MKVKDLEKGMLLECANDSDVFYLMGEGEWLGVRTKARSTRLWAIRARIKSEKIIMYLGTKKDIQIKLDWCDKFVLIGKKIVGVDPAAWQRIKILDESR